MAFSQQLLLYTSQSYMIARVLYTPLGDFDETGTCIKFQIFQSKMSTIKTASVYNKDIIFRIASAYLLELDFRVHFF